MAAEEAPARPPTPELFPGPPAAGDDWLEAVRAQRQASEQRRQAAREAQNARRRMVDPWGAARQEAFEQKVEQRRSAMRDRIERDREQFFNRGPWLNAYEPWRLDPLGKPPSSGDTTGDSATPAPGYGWGGPWYPQGKPE